MWNIIYLCHDLIKMMRFLKYISKCHQSIEPSNFLCHSLYDFLCYLNSYLTQNLKIYKVMVWYKNSHSKIPIDAILIINHHVTLGYSSYSKAFAYLTNLNIFLYPKLHIRLQHKYYYNFSHLLQCSILSFHNCILQHFLFHQCVTIEQP